MILATCGNRAARLAVPKTTKGSNASRIYRHVNSGFILQLIVLNGIFNTDELSDNNREANSERPAPATDRRDILKMAGAGHVDLYDRVNLIRWDRLTSFFSKHLTQTQIQAQIS
jgi:hypothetical protein